MEVVSRLDVTRFEECYPGWYYAPSRWPTNDGLIPFRLFWLLYHDCPRIEARRQLAQAHAIALGLELALSEQSEAKDVIARFCEANGIDA